MLKTSYANAYKEVLIILDNLIKEDYDKIPKEYIEFLKSNCNNEYEFYYDNSKTFEEQELLDYTKYILFGLFEKFGATELQKEKIKNFKKNYYNKLEEEKRNLYNSENIFKEKKVEKNENINLVIKENKKENFINKILKFIKNIFRKDN